MRITVVEANVTAAGIADIRPVGVAAPAAVRPSASHRAHAALTRRGRATSGPVLRRRQTVPGQAAATAPVVTSADTVVLSVARPPYRGAGGGPRARPATTFG